MYLANLHETVEQFLINETLQNIVHLKKTNEREGLIRARLFGANLATGQVMKGFNYLFFKSKFIPVLPYFVKE